MTGELQRKAIEKLADYIQQEKVLNILINLRIEKFGSDEDDHVRQYCFNQIKVNSEFCIL